MLDAAFYGILRFYVYLLWMVNGWQTPETIAWAHLNTTGQGKKVFFHEEWKAIVVNEWENLINWKYNDGINENFPYSNEPIELII